MGETATGMSFVPLPTTGTFSVRPAWEHHNHDP